jgi:opacity protein-like surface antigen
MKTVWLAMALGLLVPALAQAQDVELTAYGGYNLGGSIDVHEDQAQKFDTGDSFATGLSLTWQRGPSYAFEAFWGWRPTEITGRNPVTFQDVHVTDLDEHDFHANFLFMPAYSTSKITPFFLVGLGATYLNPGEVMGVSPDGVTKFSWALGAGGKTALNERIGLRGQVRYHSTYVTDEYSGTWCDPYYGCYNTVDSNWLDEWDFTLGLVFRVGRR